MRPRALCELLFLAVISASQAYAAEPGAPPAIGTSANLADRYPERRVSFPGDVWGLADVIYSTPSGFRPLTLDLYIPPPGAKAAPAIVYIHGGAWMAAMHGTAAQPGAQLAALTGTACDLLALG